MSNKRKELDRFIGVTAALAIVGALSTSVSLAQGSSQSDEPVYWFYDTDNAVGTAKLIRSPQGATGVFQTTDLPKHQAVTLWFIIFNNPEECTFDPCHVPFDIFTPGVNGDFHVAGGSVTGGNGNATFAGHIQTGDISGSGRLELGLGDEVPLMDPDKAEIVLAIHSHGPALRGQQLKHQLTSFSGGCINFIGPNGFAASPDDVPEEVGECSTIQFSRHQP